MTTRLRLRSMTNARIGAEEEFVAQFFSSVAFVLILGAILFGLRYGPAALVRSLGGARVDAGVRRANRHIQQYLDSNPIAARQVARAKWFHWIGLACLFGGLLWIFESLTREHGALPGAVLSAAGLALMGYSTYVRTTHETRALRERGSDDSGQ